MRNEAAENAFYQMMKAFGLLLISVTLVTISPAYAQETAQPAVIAACTAQQITLRTDAENGAFDGMNHSGTLVVLTNRSARACNVQAFPVITFENGAGESLGIVTQRKTPFSGPIVNGRPLPLGHGPVVRPIVLQPQAMVGAQLHWVSGAVYDRSVCFDASRVVVGIGAAVKRTDLTAHICGPDTSHVSVSTTRLSSI